MARILAMNPSLSTGEEAVPRYRRALTALGDARVDALAARLLDSRMSSRAAAPLSLRFDADSYAKIFTADDAYLSPMWLALPGLAALPTLLRELDSPRAGDQKKRIADALPLALLQAARDGERIDVELLARLELGDRDELSHSLCEALTVVLPAVDAKALARHVRDQLEAEAPASRPEQLLWVASFVEDPGVHELAVKTVIERRADIRALGLVKQAVTRLGDAALPLFERHIAISQGDRTFLGQLESVFPPPAVEALGAAQGLAKETSLQTMQRLAKAGRDHRRVYAFDLYAKLSPPRDGSLSCYDGPPPAGVEVPLRAGEPMDHVLTIDLQDAPELAALAGHEGARTLSFFLGERHEDELVEDSELVPCAAPGALHPEARPFAIVPLDLPGGVFARRTDNPELQQLRKLLFNCDGYALGEPIWIQSPEPMGTFLFQLSESFGLNLGDSGEMYVWAGGEANWQCY
ncbi:hypothetical protein G6O69_38480 [Pseudenhygromyxa sp. WMMC2535]|uniref:hypothetical protein n=1 Tax=Pseudenhygromyxa sp. WMMC2535 TaxID=2712867 RepID=UPI0015963E1D|nr:hypothetical protein [Pseudenhygromyxa sp. WMMC2535]NVB43750.1 hypothetical protein [Pseudenhygromyxa sp. WMMC2535]